MFTDLHEVSVNVCEYPEITLTNHGVFKRPIITKLTFEAVLQLKVGVIFTNPSFDLHKTFTKPS